MNTRTLLSIAETSSRLSLNVGELIQLREFIRRHPELLPEKEPDVFDAECLMAAVRIVLASTRGVI